MQMMLKWQTPQMPTLTHITMISTWVEMNSRKRQQRR